MVLNFTDEISNRAITQCFADSKITFNRKSYNHEEHSHQKRNDDTSLIYSVKSIFRIFVLRPKCTCSRSFKTIRTTHQETPDTISSENTNDGSYPGNCVAALFSLNGSCFHRRGCSWFSV